MSNKRSTVYNTMRGGQIVFHYVRMAMQVIKKNLYVFLAVIAILTGVIANAITPEVVLDRGMKYALAAAKTNYMYGGDDVTTVVNDSGKIIRTTWGKIYKNKAMREYGEGLKTRIYISFYLSLFVSVMTILCWFLYLAKRGESEATDDFIRGAILGDEKSHSKRISDDEKKTGMKSKLSVAGVKLPPKADRAGIMMIGAQGSGKSVTMTDLLIQQRAAGDKNFILDPGGEFTRKFYREGIDIILSPRDKRSHYWDVWAEGKTAESYHVTSSSLIPDTEGGDNFFNPASRFVFEAVCDKLASQAKFANEQPSLTKLTNYILRVDDETLIDIVKHSDAKSVLNKGSEKTAASIRATLSTFLQPLGKLPTFGNRFSFSEWLSRDDDSWVFIPLMPKHRAYFKPVLSMWIEHFSMGVLSLPSQSNYDGKTYNLFIDELSSYNKIPSLLMFQAEARKYGGNAVLGIQNKSQLEMIYGQKGADAIEGLTGSFCVFRSNSTKDSRWASDLLMSAEVEKTSESLSMGAADVRDSVSVNKSTKDHKLVTAAEIVNLQDLEMFLRLGRGYDVIKVTQKYTNLPDISEPLMVLSDEEISHRSALDHYDATKGGAAKKDDKPTDKKETTDSGSQPENPPVVIERAGSIKTENTPERAGGKPPAPPAEVESKATNTTNDIPPEYADYEHMYGSEPSEESAFYQPENPQSGNTQKPKNDPFKR